MNSEQLRPSQRPGTLHHEVFNEMVVYCPDTRQAASLNESARAIWELCNGSRTVDDICAELAAQTGLAAAELRNDVSNAIDVLRDLDLLTCDSA